MQKTINGVMLRKMVSSGEQLLSVNRSIVDALNVFPVPDGDTGTNMFLTMQSAVNEMKSCISTSDISEISDAVSRGALKGARGNSGVILSQIFRGLCNTIKEKEEIDTKIFSKALKNATDIAYGAVSKPKEGTILTVCRSMSEFAQQIQNKYKDFEEYFPEILKRGEEALALTPEQLPVLKKAGVVDAGGKGLLCVFRGMYMALVGEEIEGAQPETSAAIPVDDNEHADIMALDNIEFGYCSEFFIINIKKRTTLADIDKIKEFYMSMGDSVIVVGDLNYVKVHVHSNNPGLVIAKAIEIGEVDRVKIDNMREQNRVLCEKYEREKKDMGMLAISAGDGIAAIFKDLSVDRTIQGGQTMNPSANDIATAARRINARNIFVFPNNKNIILTAEQAKDLVEDRNIVVIPTKNIPQGFAAALAYNPEASVEDNKLAMIRAIDDITVGQVTYAVRDAQADGFKLKTGDIIGLDDKQILTHGNDISEATLNLVDAMKQSYHEIITLYYGSDIKEEDADALCAKLTEKYPDCEIDVHSGGQPVYYYFVSLE